LCVGIIAKHFQKSKSHWKEIPACKVYDAFYAITPYIIQKLTV